MAVLNESARRLTERRFDAIQLRGPGTELTVGLLPSSSWKRPSSRRSKGLRHFPNLPTEEVFTTPDPLRVDGHVSATMPLELYGTIIRGLRVEFAGGRVTGSTPTRTPRRCGLPSRRTREPHGSASSRSSTGAGGSGRSTRFLRHAPRRERREPHRARQRLLRTRSTDEAEQQRVNAEPDPHRLHDRPAELDVDGITAAASTCPCSETAPGRSNEAS